MSPVKRADKRMYHYLYKIIRADGSGRFYIGMHSTDKLNDGYFGSGTILSKSIKKYGKEIHNKEILEFFDSRKALKEREREIVNADLLNNRLCMNLQLGGNGGRVKGFKMSDETKAKLSATKKGKPGHLHTDETKAIMSEHANKRLYDGSMKTWSKTISAERRKEMITKANKTRRVPIQQYNLDGTFVSTWPGHVEICKSFEFNPGHLSKSLKDPLLPCGSFLWRRSKLVETHQITSGQIEKNNRYRLRGNSKKILQIDAAGNSVKIWPSVSEAVREFSCRFAIDKALKTGCLAHGFYWKKA